MKAREEDDQLHLQITKEKVLELTKIARKPNSPTVFKFKRFNEHKEQKKTFFSPPFYSSQTGYRFNIRVDAAGEDDAHDDDNDTNISVFVYLQKGRNDDSLTWPFRGSVTVELLNQLEDRNHRKVILDYSTRREAAAGIRNTGWGFSNFIHHTQLGHQPSINRQYLKDNTLVFRVSVEIPDYKPWLESTV